jgi:hypothetical protein
MARRDIKGKFTTAMAALHQDRGATDATVRYFSLDD